MNVKIKDIRRTIATAKDFLFQADAILCEMEELSRRRSQVKTDPTQMRKPWWTVLGVSRKATKRQIKRAYRIKVKKVHPDAGGTPEAFRRVQEAYKEAMA